MYLKNNGLMNISKIKIPSIYITSVFSLDYFIYLESNTSL